MRKEWWGGTQESSLLDIMLLPAVSHGGTAVHESSRQLCDLVYFVHTVESRGTDEQVHYDRLSTSIAVLPPEPIPALSQTWCDYHAARGHTATPMISRVVRLSASLHEVILQYFETEHKSSTEEWYYL